MTDLLGYAVAAGSLLAVIYAGLQARLLRQSNNASLYRSLVEVSIQFERVLVEFPSMRMNIYEGAQLPPVESEDGQRVRAVIDLALLNADLIRSQNKYIPRDARPYWTKYAKFLAESPAARAYISENSELFSTKLVNDL